MFYKQVKLFFISFLLVSYVSSCHFSTDYPLEDYYTRNYYDTDKPYNYNFDVISQEESSLSINQAEDTVDEANLQDSSNQNQPEVQNDSVDLDQDLSEDETSQANVNIEDDINQVEQEDLAPVLPPDEDENSNILADEADDLDDQVELSENESTSSPAKFDALEVSELKGQTIEEKIFFSLVNEFETRNHQKFFKFSDEFLVSYPNSVFAGQVEYMQENFYYQTEFDRDLISEGIIELGKLGFRSWDDFSQKMSDLVTYNVKAVIFNPFQNIGFDLVPFESSEFNAGALFKTDVISNVNDALASISNILADKGIKLYVKLPIRSHSWLNYSHSSLMDQTWDSTLKGSFYNDQLNVLHPKANLYLKSLIDDIAKYEISGIIIGKDYAANSLDGISDLNQILYQNETGRDFRTSSIPQRVVNFQPSYNSDVNFNDKGFLPNFINFNNWRATKIHLLLLDLVRSTRVNHPTLDVGVEILPQLINHPKSSLYNRSISYVQIVSLPVNFFVLVNDTLSFKDRSLVLSYDRYNLDYLSAARSLASSLSAEQGVFLKVHYDEQEDSLISINQKIIAAKSSGIENSSLILGPLSSFKVWETLLTNR